MPTGHIEAMIRALQPRDALGHAHRAQALDWLAGTDDIYRRVKPRTPSPHLVSYFLLVDRAASSVLLCDHRLAGLWLPTGGHVEPGEHPWATVCREIGEELGVAAVPDPVAGERPFFLTVTETVDAPERRHVDVTLWFAVAGEVGMALRPDEREFAGVRWWTSARLRSVNPAGFEPHLVRALEVLEPLPCAHRSSVE